MTAQRTAQKSWPRRRADRAKKGCTRQSGNGSARSLRGQLATRENRYRCSPPSTLPFTKRVISLRPPLAATISPTITGGAVREN